MVCFSLCVIIISLFSCSVLYNEAIINSLEALSTPKESSWRSQCRHQFRKEFGCILFDTEKGFARIVDVALLTTLSDSSSSLPLPDLISYLHYCCPSDSSIAFYITEHIFNRLESLVEEKCKLLQILIELFTFRNNPVPLTIHTLLSEKAAGLMRLPLELTSTEAGTCPSSMVTWVAMVVSLHGLLGHENIGEYIEKMQNQYSVESRTRLRQIEDAVEHLIERNISVSRGDHSNRFFPLTRPGISGITKSYIS